METPFVTEAREAPQIRGAQRPFRVSNCAGLSPVLAAPGPATWAPRGGPHNERRLGSSLRRGTAEGFRPSLRLGPVLASHRLLLGAIAGLSLLRVSVPTPAKSLRLAQTNWPLARSARPSPLPFFVCQELRLVFTFFNGCGGWGGGEGRIFHVNCDSYMKSNFGAHKWSFFGTQPCSSFMFCLWLLSC